MTVVDLSALGAGFQHAAHGSQAVFRAALHALSHPGRVVDVVHDAQVPSQRHAASAALLLALLDSDCGVWLSPGLHGSAAATWLRFHTGCHFVSDPADAHFAWVAAGDVLPPLDRFAHGSDADPERSVTCVIDVAGFRTDNDAAWTLRGPGIPHHAQLQVEGLALEGDTPFEAAWARNHAAFPRGVDIFFASPQHLVGLPRTTAITGAA